MLFEVFFLDVGGDSAMFTKIRTLFLKYAMELKCY